MPAKNVHWRKSVVAILLLLATLLVYRPSAAGAWFQALFNWLHVPVFGLISLSLLAATPVSWSPRRRFGLTFVGCLGLAVLSEAAQIPMQRDASIEDIVSDCTGALAFLLFAYGIRRGWASAVVAGIAATALLLWSALSLIAASSDFARRGAQFPIIFSGDIESEKRFVRAPNVHMETRWDASRGHLYTHVELLSEHRARLEIRDIVADWSNYSSLAMDIVVEGSEPLQITVRVHDDEHRRGSQPHNDRYNQSFVLDPGPSLLDIPLRNIAQAPQKRNLNLSEVDGLIIFTSRENTAQVFRLYEVRLD